MNEKKCDLELEIKEVLTIIHVMICINYGDYPRKKCDVDNAVNEIYTVLKNNNMSLSKNEIKKFLKEARDFKPKNMDECKELGVLTNKRHKSPTGFYLVTPTLTTNVSAIHVKLVMRVINS